MNLTKSLEINGFGSKHMLEILLMKKLIYWLKKLQNQTKFKKFSAADISQDPVSFSS